MDYVSRALVPIWVVLWLKIRTHSFEAFRHKVHVPLPGTCVANGNTKMARSLLLSWLRSKALRWQVIANETHITYYGNMHVSHLCCISPQLPRASMCDLQNAGRSRSGKPPTSASKYRESLYCESRSQLWNLATTPNSCRQMLKPHSPEPSLLVSLLVMTCIY